MKRIFCIVCILILALIICSCGADDEAGVSDDSSTESDAQIETETDSDRIMSPSEDPKLTENEEYWDSRLAGAAPDNY
ncbi:MAG: hypothetical protein IKA76_08660 [Clostridia bacterium]|nr:hypothetical protein [Clostridia bacterium]